MKTIMIVRHAKSDWGERGLADFDRPLNARGHLSAPVMAERLLVKHMVPAQLVSSPALRAITTANYFAETWEMDKNKIVKEPLIYEASSKTLLNIVNGFDNGYDFIALFGHNPGLTDLVNGLATAELVNMPTCSVAVIEFPFHDWRLVSKGTGSLRLFDYPKNAAD